MIQETLDMLSWRIKGVDQGKQATPKRELVMKIQVVFYVVLSCKQWAKDEASQPQQESALDHKRFSFYMGEE
jgi:hypothetical protein